MAESVSGAGGLVERGRVLLILRDTELRATRDASRATAALLARASRVDTNAEV